MFVRERTVRTMASAWLASTQAVVVVCRLQGRQPVSALTWGHNDRRIFVGVGCDVLTVVVLKRVASLQLLCGRRIQHRLVDESAIFQLPLPNKLQSAITELFTPTIKVPSDLAFLVSEALNG